jgi:hypothetical protein
MTSPDMDAAVCRSLGESKVLLVIAGGYDDRVDENREHLIELKQLAEELGLGIG